MAKRKREKPEKRRSSKGIRDKCEVCKGARGGTPGNENIVNGVVMCDYCHADTL